MKVSIVTLFPEMFKGPFEHSILKNAQESNTVSINFINIRDFGIGRHKVVDDKPYGGGTGMVLRFDVIENAVSFAKSQFTGNRDTQRVVLMDARGTTFSQKKALELATLNHLILIAGHYEGFDDRVTSLVDESISIGDYVLTGGEIPAMVISDAVIRLVPNVLKNEATRFESFSPEAFSHGTHLLEHPQYTRPETHKGHSVPKILLSGNHKQIEDWRKKQAHSLTEAVRPDLLKNK